LQTEITTPSDLLDKNGYLVQKGWARRPLLAYNRENIHAGWHRIKEWDYYAVLGPNYGITFTIADLGYLALCSVAWLDFNLNIAIQGQDLLLMPKGALNLPRASDSGDTKFAGKKVQLNFSADGATRVLSIDYPNFHRGKDLRGEIALRQDPLMDIIVVATPFKRKTAFYYNQKVNCMPATGVIHFGDEQLAFAPETCFGCLDWGRGVWTYKNTWYWGSASGLAGGVPVGWNIGYGFGILDTHTENMVFYNGVGHKLDEVTFNIPTDARGHEAYLQPWTFASNDGRFEMAFEPAIDRSGQMNILLLKTVQHQVFGYYTGDVVLDDGQKIHVDHLLGFAEKVFNRW